MVIPSALERRAEQPEPAERDEQPDPGDGRRQHERQLDERDAERAAGEAPAREQYAVGVPKSRISTCAIRRRLELTISASVTTGFESWSISSPGRDVEKIATIGQRRGTRARPPPRGSRRGRAALGARSTRPAALTSPTSSSGAAGSRRPASSSGRPCSSTSLMNACAAALLRARGDDRHRVGDLRLRPGRDLDHGHLAGHGLRVGRVDEAGVGLAERDLREHAADVGLLADDVREHARRQPHLLQHLQRVAPDRHGRVRRSRA